MYTKDQLFEKHYTLLQLVYLLGGGLMFVTQLGAFLNKHKTQLWRDINELTSGQLLDKDKFLKHSIVKVKAFVIQRFVGTSQVNSVSLTQYRIKKSAAICAIILQIYSKKCSTAEEFLDYAQTHSNFWSSKESDLFLLSQIYDLMRRKGMKTQGLEQVLAGQTSLDLDNWKKHYNIYVDKFGLRGTDELVVHFAILDLWKCSPEAISLHIRDICDDCNSTFENIYRISGHYHMRYEFTLYVRDDDMRQFGLMQIDKVNQRLRNLRFDPETISIDVVDLRLTSEIFSNQIICR